jgi:hypothetical protein
MSDVADLAETEQAMQLAIALSNRDRQHLHTGYCLNCDDRLPPKTAFCDTDCRADYQRRNRR